jgi:threonine/homoserine/homoserine lactone efflux protein
LVIWQYDLLMLTLDFLITAFIVVLIPGTGAVFTVSTGLMRGKRASLWAALGCTLGIVPHLLATILGLAAIMHTSALAFSVLKYAGVAYLFYLAYATWQDRSGLSFDQAPSETSAWQLVIKAILLNLLNPKLTIFFLAFLPQFVSPTAASPLAQMLLLSAVFMLMTFIVFAVYGLLAHGFRSLVMNSQRVQDWMRRSFAGAFAGLGLNLALTEQR